MVWADPEDPTAAIVAGWVTGLAVLAAWLHREGYRPPCAVIKTPVGLTALGLFLAHLAGLLGRFDPINFYSRKYPPRRCRP